MTDGLVLADKPAGMTSHDVVAALRRAWGRPKAGHAGTLDPQATGLLVVALGGATRWLPYLPSDKRYRATLRLGLRTDTQDIWGSPLPSSPPAPLPPAREVKALLEGMTGERLQVPPMVSALKHRGRPLYDYARRGQEVDRTARPVRIYALSVGRQEGDETEFEVHCSGGTYIRSLCAEAGEALGCGGCLSALRRTAVGPFRVEEAVRVESLVKEKAAGPRLLGADRSLAHLPGLRVGAAQEKLLAQGRDLPWPGGLEGEGPLRVLSDQGGLLALGRRQASPAGWRLHPERVFHPEGRIA